MRAFAPLLVVAAATLAASGVSACSRGERSPGADASSAPDAAAPGAPASVVKESLPRCRVGGPPLAMPGEDVIVGDAVVAGDALLLGVVRREGTRRVASVVRASLDLASLQVTDLGPSLGEDPPPSPRMRGAKAFVASFVRSKGAEAGTGVMGRTRSLEIARLEPSGLVAEGAVVQQADESLAYDLAWPEPEPEKGSALVAWDEDAPPGPAHFLVDRGVVKVQLLAPGAKGRVASPESSDAEAPRLLARPGGYWLAWLARRAEPREDAGASGAAEGPGERRAYRWVELVALDGKGEATSPVRRVTPEKGHVASFELARAGAQGPLVIVVQDEAASGEGAGERLVRYALEGEKVEAADLLDGGVGRAVADLVLQGGAEGGNRWLAFTDTQEHARLVPLGPSLRLAGPNTSEPALDGVRVLGASTPDVVYAVGPAGPSDARVELRRLICR